MRPDTPKRVRVATDIADNPKHPAWRTIQRRMLAAAMDDTQDMRDLTTVCPNHDLDIDAHLKWVVYTGDDSGGTNSGFFPLLEAARRLCGALLSVIGVRR